MHNDIHKLVFLIGNYLTSFFDSADRCFNEISVKQNIGLFDHIVHFVKTKLIN